MSCFFILALFATRGFGFSEPSPKESLNEYEWAELQAIAREISLAPSDEEGLSIAKRFNLCNQNGTLGYNAKTVSLIGGKEVAVCIIGFRHDVLFSGSGKAGITFCFTSAVTSSSYNDIPHGGDWLNCSLRDYMRSKDFMQLIPLVVRQGVRGVVKCRDEESGRGGYDAFPDLEEGFFPLSVVEYAGVGEVSPLFEDQGGKGETQYQFFQEGHYLNYGVSDIWTRTEDTVNSNNAYAVSPDGSIVSLEQDWICGVAPAFCF